MKLVIDNIAKIEHAEVKFDGLTVICGRNDTKVERILIEGSQGDSSARSKVISSRRMAEDIRVSAGQIFTGNCAKAVSQCIWQTDIKNRIYTCV
ncbi:MAG: hypothetical protein IJ716_09720 [Lachnospiraceae bacterium]|nr:hypothetical protein [Lachnospiraceae bacterium]